MRLAVKEDASASPVAREFLRQALDVESPQPGRFDLHRLWKANPEAPIAPPLLWKFVGKAAHGKDPLEGAEVIDGKVYAEPIMAADYTIFIGNLGDDFNAFIAETTGIDWIEAVTRNTTTDRAFFAVALTLGVNAEKGLALETIEAINHLIACAAKRSKDSETRVLAALFGNSV